MSYTHPRYGIVTPDNQTAAKNLGAELKAMGASMVSALDSFDYNGADPNLVLARVAALEARAAKRKVGITPYVGDNGGAGGGFTWTNVKTVTFPEAFPAGLIPSVHIQSVVGADHVSFSHIISVTSSGFTFRVERLGATAPASGSIHWTAELP